MVAHACTSATGYQRFMAAKKKKKKKVGAKVAKRTVDESKECAQWLRTLGVKASKPAWYVRVYVDVKDAPAMDIYSSDTDTRFHLEVYAAQWRLYFMKPGTEGEVYADADNGVYVNRLNVADPSLSRALDILRELEKRHGVAFRREHARVETNIAGAKEAVRNWLV
jgi:hypothetical protein